MKKIALSLIRLYQLVISNGLFKLVFIGSCRFQPSCSQYTYQAVEKYGTIRGLSMGLKRLFRCHPFSKGGYNPIE